MKNILFVLLLTAAVFAVNVHAYEVNIGRTEINRLINSMNESDIDIGRINSVLDIESMPDEVKGIIGNEKINIYVEGIGRPLYVALSDGKITDAGIGARKEATMNIHTDIDTIEEIVEGKKSFQEALKDGTLSYGGNDFFSSLKFAFLNFLMWLAGLFGLI